MKKYFVKYLLEFIVIVFGVSLSFYVENYIENKKKDGLKNQSLKRILQNIETDISDNNINLKYHSGSLSSSYWLIKNKKKTFKFFTRHYRIPFFKSYR